MVTTNDQGEDAMSSRLTVLSVVIAAFGALTLAALADVGYLGIFEPHFQSLGGAQVLADLVILGALAIVWMVGDARERGVAAWPFVLLTLAAGSFGPLLYLVVRELRSPVRQAAVA
jgi:hypothetical protein